VSAKLTYITRIVDPLLSEYLSGLPAVMLVGPRATGKTTTALRSGASTMRLDRASTADAVRADPDAALTAYDEPVVIDEWQLVPEVLGAVKRAVDADAGPGRFILTGSSSTDLTTVGWPATGRVVRIPVWGLTERELVGDATARPFISRLFDGSIDALGLPSTVPALRDYIDLAMRGAFPEIVRQPSERLRRAWLASYVDQLVSRDIALAGPTRDPVRLRRYLQALAANTAGNPDRKTVYDAAEVNRLTALAYDDALQSLLVLEHLPAWTSSRLGQLSGLPKVHITDPGLLGPLLGIDTRAVLRNADLLGRIIDSFVTAQLRAELPVSDEAPRMFHLRESHGRQEIDLILEAADGRIVALEIKADASPPAKSARHLRWLRDRLGDRFTFGAVLHSGPLPYMIDDRVAALPICSIWGPASNGRTPPE
jgi:uncharacterized protein